MWNQLKDKKTQLIALGGVITAVVVAAGTIYWYTKSKPKEPPKIQKIKVKTALTELQKEIQREFELSLPKIEEIRDIMVREMKLGLLPNSESSLKMIPTFITKLPTGVEVGTAHAIDIGGSNMRVLKVDLDGYGHATIVKSEQVKIPDKIQKSDADTLFDFIAESVGKVVQNAPVGFTFSFPIDQKRIDSGLLINWTKGFTASGVVNKDVVSLLNVACKKKILMPKLMY